VSARFELALVDAYRERLSPWLGAAGVRCRFEPTCSRYARGAIAKSGGLAGPLRAAWRVVRCGPWTPQGTVDPP
jgi:putative membrane protein insertion efficiency factor